LTKRKKRRPETAKAKYQATEKEKAALNDHVARLGAAPIGPLIKVTKGEKETKIGIDHPNESLGLVLFMEALGTADYSFGLNLITQLADTNSRGGEVDAGRVNFMLAVIKNIKPKDHVEAMLAAQMAGIHLATMTFIQRLANVENIPQQDSAERTLNKLARTYAGQMETLKRYRTGGEQKVTVQHVSVSEGGQAIVGNVTQANPEKMSEKSAASPPPALTHAKTPQMPIINEREKPVPVRARRVRQK
jgi:hypothetical protein